MHEIAIRPCRDSDIRRGAHVAIKDHGSGKDRTGIILERYDDAAVDRQRKQPFALIAFDDSNDTGIVDLDKLGVDRPAYDGCYTQGLWIVGPRPHTSVPVFA